MKAIPRNLPSPAMIVACLALIVALGGVSYAAGVLPAGSVGAKQLRKGGVTNSKLHKGAVTPSKVDPRTIALFKGQQGPAGAAGPKGDPGVPGPQGPKGDTGDPAALKLRIVKAQLAVPSGSADRLEAQCAPGERATGGGIVAVNSDFVGISFDAPVAAPDGTPVGWKAGFRNNSAVTLTVEVHVICAAA